MRIDVVTVSFNVEETIADTVYSVSSQSFHSKHHFVVDGKSTDNTISIIKSFDLSSLSFLSEQDSGLYDAMNKGIRMATGDVVGVLNSDDVFYNNQVLTKVGSAFQDDPNLDAVIGDIVFVKEDDLNQVVRRYSAKNWKPSKFAWGYMPPHPSFFVRREWFEKLGYYKTDYKIAADYELLIRFLLKGGLRWKYLPITTTKMRMGGLSTRGIQSLITLNKEIYRACKENDVYTNYAMIYSKYLFKPFEFIFK
ncbi:Glycosyl transferase family 2 [Cyclobacterium lianum]|uniref:Glycosyl transferase family 2 n=1 Tax=Cyclobacterium lianum TaxID=388280 RepID=A0A1M7NSH8_9BACT|nr:glycosyltransferase family 2 protein [Cyclobacterium lianum]SHN06849.1 Glycosyl transferase family 2 [Cyclobacterium lianum]